jgi:pantothenate kinase type III
VEHLGPWGRDTQAGLWLGPRIAIAALAERALAQLEQEAGHEARLILTGGDAGEIAPFLTCAPALRPDLVLAGLYLLAQEVSR